MPYTERTAGHCRIINRDSLVKISTLFIKAAAAFPFKTADNFFGYIIFSCRQIKSICHDLITAVDNNDTAIIQIRYGLHLGIQAYIIGLIRRHIPGAGHSVA